MNQNMTEKRIASHWETGEMVPGSEIGNPIERTLTQDALGTMAFREFEAIGMKRVKTKLSVSWVDHLTLPEGFENSDDHLHIGFSISVTASVTRSRPRTNWPHNSMSIV